jgi:hypothetical protein
MVGREDEAHFISPKALLAGEERQVVAVSKVG